MKRSILFLVLINVFSSLFAQYKVSGGSGQPLLATKNGFTEVYLLNGLEGAEISFTSTQSGAHQWYRYERSIDDAVPIPCVQNGNNSVITTDVWDGYGYYVAAPMGTGYIWIIDYSKYTTQFTGLYAMEDDFKCEQLKLIPMANFEPIYYYLRGGRNTLQRKFLLTYNTLKWEDDMKMFTPLEINRELEGLFSEITIDPPPLTNTTFTLNDSFAEHFGIQLSITSTEYQAVAVESHYTAETDKEHAENEIHQEGDFLGGSAPVEYQFTAYANEPVATLYIWKITHIDSLGTETPIVSHWDRFLQYNFDKDGKYLVDLEVRNSQSNCVATDSINIVIESTVIKIPNAFSPGSSIGVNDELRISFSSLITFKASVYNRWGNLLFQWTDPAKGWDGRVNGKFVPTGAYVVIVEYKDSSGKSRTMSKTVNVLQAKDL